MREYGEAARSEQPTSATSSSTDDRRRSDQSRPQTQRSRPPARARRNGLGSRRHVLDGGRRRVDARRQARPRGDRLRVLDGSDRGHQPPVRPVRQGDRVHHGRRAPARPQGLSRCASGEARPGLDRLHAAGRTSLARRPPGLVALRARCELAASRRDPTAESKGKTTIPSSRFAGTTPSPTPTGPASGCRPRRNGNSRRAAARRGRATSGATTCVPGGKWQANIWEGHFPDQNSCRRRIRPHRAGRARFLPTASACTTSPATSGNGAATGIVRVMRPSAARDPAGPASSYDPDEPGVPKRVQRGGSFLCSDQYCTRYLPGAGQRRRRQRGLARGISVRAVTGSGKLSRFGRTARSDKIDGPAMTGRVLGECPSSLGGVRRAVPTWLSYVYNWLFSEFLTHLGFLLALVLMAGLLRQRRSPSSTIAWLLVILLLPYIGVPLYIMFGGRKMQADGPAKAADLPPMPADAHGGDQCGTVERLLASYGVPPATAGNRVELVTSGVDAYRARDAADRAGPVDDPHHDLHPGPGRGSQALVDCLTRRAAEGVSVRLLLDDVGSWRVRRRFLARLIEAGAQVAFFMPVLHIPFRGRANLRNHRKLVVVDSTNRADRRHEPCVAVHRAAGLARLVARFIDGRRRAGGGGARGALRVRLAVHHRPRPDRGRASPSRDPATGGDGVERGPSRAPAGRTSPATRSTSRCWP